MPSATQTSKRPLRSSAVTPEVRHSLLMDVSLERSAHSDFVQNQSEADYRYSADARIVGRDDGLAIVVCDFSAEQIFREVTLVSIQASYAVGLANTDELTDEAVRSVMSAVAGRETWARFRDLHSFLQSQCGLQLPLLPFVAEIEWEVDAPQPPSKAKTPARGTPKKRAAAERETKRTARKLQQ